MIEVPLISTELFLEHSPVTFDTDVRKFVPFINIAQEMYIVPILGDPLTEELQEQIKTNTLTPDNKALVNKIASPLAYYAVYQGLPFHWAKIINKGVTNADSPNSSTVSFDDLSGMRRYTRDAADFLAKQLVTYLCGCRSKYPAWRPDKNTACGGCGDTNGANASESDSGIFIPNRRNNTGY